MQLILSFVSKADEWNDYNINWTIEICYQISFPSNKAKVKPFDDLIYNIKNGDILRVHFPRPENSIIVENGIYDSFFYCLMSEKKHPEKNPNLA